MPAAENLHRFELMHRSKSRPIDQPIGADVRGLIRATPLSEDPQLAASRLIARRERSTK